MKIVSCKYCEFSIDKLKKSLPHPVHEIHTLAISLIDTRNRRSQVWMLLFKTDQSEGIPGGSIRQQGL